jgi:uncharacterized RDD family membrane protein YckC
LSTLPSQANVSPTWKQEVNQLVAAHKDRRTVSAEEPETQSESLHSASSRAAAAAARVAARFANAPSYSETLANEARAAIRAAEAASKAALEAQAVAEQVLAEIEAASAAQPSWELHSPEADAENQLASGEAGTDRVDEFRAGQGSVREGFEIRWEPGLPVRQTEIASARATPGTEIQETALDEWREPTWPAQDGPGGEAIVPVEPAQPIHANLIEFPREIVATRKVRPRLLEGQLGASGGQLSIFEVDPGSISTEPLIAGAAGVASAATWTGPEWSGIELDAQPRQEFLEEAAEQTPNAKETQVNDAFDGVRNLDLAPMNLRLMAALVNGSLVMAAAVAAILLMAGNAKSLLPMREAEVGGILALVVIGGLYHALFYAFSKRTPGMRYANISLSTFDGKNPTRAQRFGRLGALLLSVLPVGLGIVWAMFDEDHLSWHDRLSQTYLRKS